MVLAQVVALKEFLLKYGSQEPVSEVGLNLICALPIQIQIIHRLPLPESNYLHFGLTEVQVECVECTISAQHSAYPCRGL